MKPFFKKGFTVLELIVVMTVVFIMLGLSVPAYQSAMKGNAPVSGATQIAMYLNLARQNAMTTHRSTAMIFSVNTIINIASTNQQVQSLVSYALLQKDTNDINWVYIDNWHFLPQGAFIDSPVPSTPTIQSFPFPTNGAALLSSTNYIQFESTGEASSSLYFFIRQGLVRNGSNVNSSAFNVVSGLVYKTTGTVKVFL